MQLVTCDRYLWTFAPAAARSTRKPRNYNSVAKQERILFRAWAYYGMSYLIETLRGPISPTIFAKNNVGLGPISSVPMVLFLLFRHGLRCAEVCAGYESELFTSRLVT